MVAPWRMAPVDAFVQGSRRQRHTRRPHAVHICGALMARRPDRSVQVSAVSTGLQFGVEPPKVPGATGEGRAGKALPSLRSF